VRDLGDDETMARATAHEIHQRARLPQLTADPVVTRAKACLMLTLAARL